MATGRYTARYSMPRSCEAEAPSWYSFNNKNVHFVMLSTEHSLAVNSTQYNWLKADLEAADAVATRTARPWVLVNGHYPPVCSHDDVCGRLSGKYSADELDAPDGLLGLLARHRVDASLWGHIHAYERTYPLVHQRVADPRNETGTVHLMVGMAGAGYSGGHWRYDQPAYSAFREDSYGYVRATVRGGAALTFEYVRNDNGKVQDAVTITKQPRGAGTRTPAHAHGGSRRRRAGPPTPMQEQHTDLGFRGDPFPDATGMEAWAAAEVQQARAQARAQPPTNAICPSYNGTR